MNNFTKSFAYFKQYPLIKCFLFSHVQNCFFASPEIPDKNSFEMQNKLIEIIKIKTLEDILKQVPNHVIKEYKEYKNNGRKNVCLVYSNGFFLVSLYSFDFYKKIMDKKAVLITNERI